ncbi:MAG: helix-turn-helix domain-containing protein [Patescibacteria group bacterium]
MNLVSVVKNIGLGDKEAKVYLACLELGSTGVAEIARRARINRVTAYDILEKLMHKGMVNTFQKKGTRFYDATDPQVVAAEVKRKAGNFKKAIPDFKRLRGEAIHPRIRYFEGLDGIKAIYEDTLASKTEILNYSNSREIRNHWPEYDEEYVAQRVKHKVYLRGISPMDEHGKWVKEHDKASYREIRLVPSKEFTFTNEINIYDDKVAIISYTDVPLIGMIIESLEIANTQRDIFKMAWEFAGKY